MDRILRSYKIFAQIPALVDAKLSNSLRLVDTVWSQRNLDRGKMIRFRKNIILNTELNKLDECIPVDTTNELLTATSPSEEKRAVLRDVESKQYLEIWKNNNLTLTVDLNALDIHGNVYTDANWASFAWSPDETKLLYIAEQKPLKSEPFYKRANGNKKDDVEKTTGEQYLFRQDWGEQMVGKVKSVIAQYDLETDSITILGGIPKDVCPAQVIYGPEGNYVVGVAYKTEPRKLGLIYCTNRENTIFKLDFHENYFEFEFKGKSVKSPRFTPDGNFLIWMERNVDAPHHSVMTLKKTVVPLVEHPDVSTVVDFIKNQMIINNNRVFYGLYNTDFPKRCFASGNRLLLSTNQKTTINTYVIEIDSGKITELIYNEGSQVVLDVFNDYVLINRRNFLKSDQLVIGKLSNNFHQLTNTEVEEDLQNCTYEYLDLEQPHDDVVKKFSAIYVGPKCGEKESISLILWPHGGPHSAFANNMFLEMGLFLSLGYAVLLINYRGSIGAGGDNVNYLLGKIGKTDVVDCVLSCETALTKYPWLNPKKIALVGGSHGGFLVTHLSGQYPDKFKVVIARNPVIDVASMSTCSDIPDWCYAEGGFNQYKQSGALDDQTILTLRKISPIEHAHKVKAPTLLQIGSKDLRVPPQQGVEYYTRLKANGVPVQMNLYDDNHTLSSVPNEMDNLINTVLWIEKHL